VNVSAVLGTMSELRWTLLIIGVLFVAALAWWERRRPRQASGTVERSPLGPSPGSSPRALREPPLVLPEIRAREPLVPRALPVVEAPPDDPPTEVEIGRADPAHGDISRGEVEWAGAEKNGARESVAEESALERLGAPPTLGAADSADASEPAASIPRQASPGAPALPREKLPELPAAGSPPLVEWPTDRDRFVLTLRLVAPQPERFAGRSLRQALAAEGFVLGQFAIFHKPDEERRAVMSAASLTRPGTFDMDTMDSQHYGGLSLFAVLPGPKSPPQTFEELVFTARNLNERLHGVLQDEQGSPLTPARIALLREQLRGGTAS
jgi:cell division protein ZipA